MKGKFVVDPFLESDFVPPCAGNGFLGARVDKLLISTEKYLPVVGTGLYDDGIQLELPSPLMPEIFIGRKKYDCQHGIHDARLQLETATGEYQLTDRWQYSEDRHAEIHLRMLIPRPCRRFLLFDCTINAADTIQLNQSFVLPESPRFTMRSTSRGNHFLRNSYTTLHSGETFTQELRWQSSVLPETDHSDFLQFTSEQQLSITFQMAVNDEFPSLSSSELRRSNRREWNGLWSRALEMPELSPERRDQLELFQYQLLANINTAGIVCGPLGVSAIGWNGNQFWDSDFWLFRPLLKLWPELARSILQYRLNTLDTAKDQAQQQGLPGALYGFKSDDRGVDRTPPAWRSELHINCWIALAAIEFYRTTGDRTFLILRDEIAKMLYHRGEFDQNGRFHLRFIIGPDECVAERDHTKCSDNYLTNYAAAIVLKSTADTAFIQAAENMYYPPMNPATEIFPTFDGYQGAEIKQADLILIFYPLGFPSDQRIIRKNIEYYNERTYAGGPMMTTGIECAILAALGDRSAALTRLFQDSEPFVHGTFRVVCETRNRGKSCFLTGIGAFLHGLLALEQPSFTRAIYQDESEKGKSL